MKRPGMLQTKPSIQNNKQREANKNCTIYYQTDKLEIIMKMSKLNREFGVDAKNNIENATQKSLMEH